MKMIISSLLLVTALFFMNGCVVAAVGTAGAIGGYEAHKAGYRINITKTAPGKPESVKKQK